MNVRGRAASQSAGPGPGRLGRGWPGPCLSEVPHSHEAGAHPQVQSDWPPPCPAAERSGDSGLGRQARVRQHWRHPGRRTVTVTVPAGKPARAARPLAPWAVTVTGGTVSGPGVTVTRPARPGGRVAGAARRGRASLCALNRASNAGSRSGGGTVTVTRRDGPGPRPLTPGSHDFKCPGLVPTARAGRPQVRRRQRPGPRPCASGGPQRIQR